MEGGIQKFAKAAANGQPQEVQGGAPPGRKYRGVVRRPGGKWGAYIYESWTHHKVWLGTYDTREEAACAYDAASRTLRPRAKTNFPEPAGEEEKRAAVVVAHFAGLKRKSEVKLNKEAWRKMEADIIAATAAVAAFCDGVKPPPAPGPAPGCGASASQPAPAPAAEAFESQSARAPVGVSSIRLFGVDVVLAPAPDVGFPQPMAPPSAAPAPASTLPHFAIGETSQGSGNGHRSWCA
ncbi:hypothetical protein EJB05_41635, partial [Eragrostis curvula]